jgi:DNA repair protein RadC
MTVKSVSVPEYVAEPSRAPVRVRRGISGPEDVAREFWRVVPRDEKREHFAALYLDARNVPLDVQIVSIGSLNASIVHPREVFRPAVLHAAAGVIVAHNHPSGDPSPSEEDVAITRRLHECGRMLGIEMLDHVVCVAEPEGCYVSLRERRLL